MHTHMHEREKERRTGKKIRLRRGGEDEEGKISGAARGRREGQR